MELLWYQYFGGIRAILKVGSGIPYIAITLNVGLTKA